MIDRRTIDQILDRAEIVDVVSDFVTLHKKGRDFTGLCPFHDDSRPSFHVSVSKNICKCFACNEGGTPLSFIMKHENFSFVEAIKYLGRKYGIEVKEKEASAEEIAKRSEREQLLQTNSFARDLFVEGLHQNAEGRRIGLSYFRERGLTDETIKHFELGYSPSNATYLSQQAEAKKIDLDRLEQLGLVMKSSRGEWIDRYRDRIIFPIHSISGNIVGFGGRILKKVENVGKYINSPTSSIYDKSHELYGLYYAKRDLSKENACIVVEGYMDVLSMHQRGIRNVVASSGTALTPQQVQMIKRYTSNVVLIFDSDGAGIKAALKGLDVCLSKAMSVHIVLLPEGEDPDSFAMAHTFEEVQSYIHEHKQDGLSFKADMLERTLGNSVQAKTEIVEALAESMAYIADDITREFYVAAIAEHMQITPQLLVERVVRIRHARQSEAQRAYIREMEQIHRQEKATTPVQNGFQNISTKPIIGKVQAKVQRPTIKEPLDPHEVTLLRYIVEDGIRYISTYALNIENVEHFGASVIEIVFHETLDLREKKALTPRFVKLLDELIEQHETAPEFDPSKFLTRHEDDTIRYFAEEIIKEDWRLSSIHEGYKEEIKQEEVLLRMIMKDLITYKLRTVEQELADTLTEIETLASKGATEEEIDKTTARVDEIVKMKAMISKMTGDRVLTPKSRI